MLIRFHYVMLLLGATEAIPLPSLWLGRVRKFLHCPRNGLMLPVLPFSSGDCVAPARTPPKWSSQFSSSVAIHYYLGQSHREANPHSAPSNQLCSTNWMGQGNVILFGLTMEYISSSPKLYPLLERNRQNF